MKNEKDKQHIFKPLLAKYYSLIHLNIHQSLIFTHLVTTHTFLVYNECFIALLQHLLEGGIYWAASEHFIINVTENMLEAVKMLLSQWLYACLLLLLLLLFNLLKYFFYSIDLIR